MRPAFRQHALETLRRGRWFGSMPDELQNLILDNSVLRVCEPDQVLVVEDSPPAGLFAVLEGQVAITRQVGTEHEFFVHLACQGFWFAESGLFNREYSATTSICRTPCRLLLLTISGFDRIVESRSDFYRLFTLLNINRYSHLLRLLGQSTFLPAKELLKVRLADLADLIQQEGIHNDMMELALTQTDIGNMIGTTRQTAGQLLKELEAEGLIETSFRRIRILDKSGLRHHHRKTGLH